MAPSDLTGNILGEVPTANWVEVPNLTFLYEYSNLTWLGINGAIKHSSLANTFISRVRAGAFAGLGSLGQLYLYFCHINVIEIGAWQGLSALKDLYRQSDASSLDSSCSSSRHLAGLAIAVLPVRVFDGLVALQTL